MKRIILYISLGLLGLLALTNPTERAHKDKIKTEVKKMLEPTVPKDVWDLIVWDANRSILLKTIDMVYQRNNYVLFSTVTDNQNKIMTFGIFGFVFSKN